MMSQGTQGSESARHESAVLLAVFAARWRVTICPGAAAQSLIGQTISGLDNDHARLGRIFGLLEGYSGGQTGLRGYAADPQPQGHHAEALLDTAEAKPTTARLSYDVYTAVAKRRLGCEPLPSFGARRLENLPNYPYRALAVIYTLTRVFELLLSLSQSLRRLVLPCTPAPRSISGCLG